MKNRLYSFFGTTAGVTVAVVGGIAIGAFFYMLMDNCDNGSISACLMLMD